MGERVDQPQQPGIGALRRVGGGGPAARGGGGEVAQVGVFHLVQAQGPAGVVVRPEDIAHGVRYLVSDDAAMVHGSTLDIDGGISATRLG